MRALVFIYMIEEVAHAHAQNAPLEWFPSTPGLGIVLRLLNKVCWLCIQRSTFMVMFIPGHMYDCMQGWPISRGSGG